MRELTALINNTEANISAETFEYTGEFSTHMMLSLREKMFLLGNNMKS